MRLSTFEIVLLLALTGCQAARTPEVPDLFGIYTANLDGTNMRRIVADSWRELSHSRVSPNHQWITFSRYNNRQNDGLATEEGGYDNTEVLIARIDGSDVRSVAPAQKGAASVNSYWTPDGKALIYLVFDEKTKPEVTFIHFNERMEVEKRTTFSTPDHLAPADPSQVGNSIVFPAVDRRDGSRGLWLVNVDGTNLRQITALKDPKTGERITSGSAGENDPKLAPDGSKVAFMRYIPGQFLWHTIVIDLATGKEKDLSVEFIGDSVWEAEGIPEWSSDGKLVIDWHTNVKNNQTTFFTMRPDGSARQRVPLPQFEGDHYYSIKGPAFFPNTGSGPDAKIVFGAKRIPRSELKDSVFKRLWKRVLLAFM